MGKVRKGEGVVEEGIGGELRKGKVGGGRSEEGRWGEVRKGEGER